jgi:hypothetical protein
MTAAALDAENATKDAERDAALDAEEAAKVKAAADEEAAEGALRIKYEADLEEYKNKIAERDSFESLLNGTTDEDLETSYLDGMAKAAGEA